MKNIPGNTSKLPRRRLIRYLLATSGAAVTAKSLPEIWKKPSIKSVILPAHAGTTPPAGSVSLSNLTTHANAPAGAGFTGPLDFCFDFSQFPQFTTTEFQVFGPNSTSLFASGLVPRPLGTETGNVFCASSSDISWVSGNYRVRINASGPALASRNNFSLIKTAYAQEDSEEASISGTTDPDTDT